MSSPLIPVMSGMLVPALNLPSPPAQHHKASVVASFFLVLLPESMPDEQPSAEPKAVPTRPASPACTNERRERSIAAYLPIRGSRKSWLPSARIPPGPRAAARSALVGAAAAPPSRVTDNAAAAFANASRSASGRSHRVAAMKPAANTSPAGRVDRRDRDTRYAGPL